MKIRPSWVRIAGGLISAVIMVAGSGSIIPASASSPIRSPGALPTDVGVGGDDNHDLYRGTGGLLVGAGYRGDQADRVESATCADCRWKITAMCVAPDHSPEDLCAGSLVGCPFGQLRVRVLLARFGQAYREIGTTCLGPGGPVTVAELIARLRDVAITHVPALVPGYQPVGLAVVGIPVIWRTGQPRSLGARDLVVLGHDVVLAATASWVWTYGDGTTETTSKPGGLWPDNSVSHTYRRAARLRATVTTVWSATFRVDGLGPFAVTGDVVRQDATIALDVRPAHAQLIRG